MLNKGSVSCAWRHLQPPAGLQVRRLVVLLCLAVAMPRIIKPNGITFLLPRLGIGWAFFALAVALAVTSWRWRKRWPGRLVAAVGFAMFVTLMIDAWGVSPTSAMISLAISVAMMGEVVASYDC